MTRFWVAVAALNGLIAVAAGAYAAHGLQVSAGAEAAAWMETGSRYQMWHALALLAAVLFGRDGVGRDEVGRGGGSAWLGAAAWAFLAGTVLFAGSLYVMALSDLRAVAWITPIGGASFLLGWGLLAIYGLRR